MCGKCQHQGSLPLHTFGKPANLHIRINAEQPDQSLKGLI